MMHSLAGPGRLVGCERDPRDSFWKGRLTPGDGGDVRGTVRIGPVSAWRTEDQALVAGLAEDLEDQSLLAADGLDCQRMIVIDHGCAVLLHEFPEALNQFHRILIVLLITLKKTYTGRVSTLTRELPVAPRKTAAGSARHD
jgi:hypothetical protein